MVMLTKGKESREGKIGLLDFYIALAEFYDYGDTVLK